MTREFVRRVRLPVPAGEAFDWHERPGAFERLNPPWASVTVLRAEGGIRDGARVSLRLPGPLPVTWDLEHRDYEHPVRFRDVQLRGPFAAWEHEHAFEPDGPEACVLTDRVRWELPLAPLSAPAAGSVEREIARLFTWRHRVTLSDLEARREAGLGCRRVVLAGAGGMLGRALTAFLSTQGHVVRRLVRRPPRRADERGWDPANGTLDPAALADADVVVNLAGAGIADQRWTPARKRELIESRVGPTALLARTISALPAPPRVFVSVSASGFYGDRGDEALDETSVRGRGFFGDLGEAWEAAAAPAAAAGTRVVIPRLGIVLTPSGGALAKLVTPTLWGAGGPLGSGRQWWPWISLEDVLRAFLHLVARDDLRGPVNLCAPGDCRQLAIARALARVVGRPAIAPAPAFALRLLLGEMADAALLGSQRMRPAALLASGFRFRDPDLEPALRAMLGRA